MFGTPYSTTIGSKFRLDRVMAKLQEADILKQLTVLDPEMPWLVAVLGKESVEIPTFNHPITMTDPNRGTKVVVDLRSYGRLLEILPDRVRVAQYGGAALTINRAILQYEWRADTADEFVDASDMPIAVYSRWLADQLSRGLALDALQQQRLPVLFAYFYYAQFMADGELTPTMAQRLAPKIARTLRIRDVTTVLQNIPSTLPTNVTQLVALLSSGEYGIRLESLSIGVFWQVTTSGMYGIMNAAEVMAVAIEYPPTFLAIMHAALNDRGYNKTPLTNAAKPYDRNGAGKQFNQAFDGLLGVAKE